MSWGLGGDLHKAVAPPLGYPELVLVFGAQQEAPLAERERSAANILRHVEHLTLYHLSWLALGLSDLVVPAAQQTQAGLGVVVLCEIDLVVAHGFFEAGLVEILEKSSHGRRQRPRSRTG